MTVTDSGNARGSAPRVVAHRCGFDIRRVIQRGLQDNAARATMGEVQPVGIAAARSRPPGWHAYERWSAFPEELALSELLN